MMTGLSTAWRELIALFIDDGSFALSILAWLAGGAICLHVFEVPAAVEGFLLAAGFVMILAENVERTAREAKR
jgi:hypothetical protein